MTVGRALCARCRTEFTKTNPRQIYCTAECRRAASKDAEKARIASGLVTRRRHRPGVSIEDVIAFCDRVKKETGRYIQYGHAVEIIEGRRTPPKKEE